ncbi:MAG: DUF6279 family lipoprotein [Thiolinea sp.]
MRKSIYNRLLVLILLLTIAGCTGTQFGYRFLDSLMRWRLNEYVSLQGEQSREVDAALDAFHTWHQRDQLPLYKNFLAKQTTVLEREAINAAQLQQAYESGIVFWKDSMERLLPDAARMLSQLDQAQLIQLQKNMDAKNAEYEEERISPPLAKRQQERQKRMRETLEKWIGDLTETQEQRLKEWVTDLNYETGARLQQRRLLRERFEQLLPLRKQPERLQQALAQLMVHPERQWTPAYRKYVYFNRQQTYRLLIDLHRSLTEKQKKRLLDKLEGYQQDFANLSA